MKILCYLVTTLVLILSSCSQHHQKINKNATTTATQAEKEGLQTIEPPTKEALKADPNILWIGEVMMDYAPDYDGSRASLTVQNDMAGLGLDDDNKVKTLKLQLEDLETKNFEPIQLQDKILANITQIECYADSKLTQRYTSKESLEQLITRDTILTFDPQTFEEFVQERVRSIDSKDIIAFRVKQYLYYDEAAATLKTIPLAIAPLFKKTNIDKSITIKPIFWFKPTYFAEMPSLRHPAISYAKRTYQIIHWQDMQVVKMMETMGGITLKMIADVKQNSNVKYIGDPFDVDGVTRLGRAEIDKLDNALDTVHTFHPETFEHLFVEIDNTSRIEEILKFLVIQNWIWDEEKNQLSIQFVGVAPIVNLRDSKGGIFGERPLFYRRPDLDTPIKTTK